MNKFKSMEEQEVFMAACNFTMSKKDIKIDNENFKEMAVKAFKLYKSFMEVGTDVRRR